VISIWMCGRFLPIVSDGGWHPHFCFPIFLNRLFTSEGNGDDADYNYEIWNIVFK